MGWRLYFKWRLLEPRSPILQFACPAFKKQVEKPQVITWSTPLHPQLNAYFIMSISQKEIYLCPHPQLQSPNSDILPQGKCSPWNRKLWISSQATDLIETECGELNPREFSCITDSVIMLYLHTNALDRSGHCGPTQGDTNMWPSLTHFYPASLYYFWQEYPMRYKVLSLPPTGLGGRNRRTVIVISELRETRLLSWRRKWQPTPEFLPRESQGWGSLVGCRLWGRTESDTTKATSLSLNGLILM